MAAGHRSYSSSNQLIDAASGRSFEAELSAERGKDTSTGVGVSEAMVQYRVTTLGQEAPELAAILAGAA